MSQVWTSVQTWGAETEVWYGVKTVVVLTPFTPGISIGRIDTIFEDLPQILIFTNKQKRLLPFII